MWCLYLVRKHQTKYAKQFKKSLELRSLFCIPNPRLNYRYENATERDHDEELGEDGLRFQDNSINRNEF